MKMKLSPANAALALLCAAFLLAFLNSTAQTPLSKSTKDGWALQVGAGYYYGGNIGLLCERQILLKEKLRVTPFASVGFGEGGKDTLGQRYDWLGLTTGAVMEYGKQHRIIFGPQLVMSQSLGTNVDLRKNQLAGMSWILGYKGTARFGLIWQVYIGDIYMQEPTSTSKAFSHSSQAGLGLGYKL